MAQEFCWKFICDQGKCGQILLTDITIDVSHPVVTETKMAEAYYELARAGWKSVKPGPGEAQVIDNMKHYCQWHGYRKTYEGEKNG